MYYILFSIVCAFLIGVCAISLFNDYVDMINNK